mgnify:CR=1 FL=1
MCVRAHHGPGRQPVRAGAVGGHVRAGGGDRDQRIKKLRGANVVEPSDNLHLGPFILSPVEDTDHLSNVIVGQLVGGPQDPQGGELLAPVELELDDVDPYAYTGAAENHTKLVNIMHVVNAAGLCMFGYLSYPAQCIPDQLSAVTGWDYDMEEVYKTGKRIGTIRHAFNLREGHNPLTRNVPGRLVGKPPLSEGNLKGVTVDYRNLNREFLERCGWDLETTIPSEQALRYLGMEFLLDDRATWDVPAVE